MEVTEIELGWLAGFFDGEGCISLRRHRDNPKLYRSYPELIITNTDKGLIDRAQNILDVLHIDSSITSCQSSKNPNHHLVYRLRIRNYSSIHTFMAKVPIKSADKLEKWEKLKDMRWKGRKISKPRRERLVRSDQALC